MLAHSPPLPLFIDYRNRCITAEVEEGIFLALKQLNRIRGIRVGLSFQNLQKFIMVIDGELPILEYLIMAASGDDHDTKLVFPETIQASHLRHLVLDGVAPPIGSLLLTTAMGLVTLRLIMNHPPTYLNPNSLLQWIPPLSQLETLDVTVSYRLPVNHDDAVVAYASHHTHHTP